MTAPQYKNVKYTTEITIAKSPEEVFSHLVDLRKWWPEDFDGEDIGLDSVFVFTTGPGHWSKNKVIEYEPNKKLAWRATESLRETDKFDWSGTKFIFELLSKGELTLVRFTYDGLVLERETDLLARICDMTVKELFYNYIMLGKSK